MLVIARAYGDEPLRRIATGKIRGLTYVVNPQIVESSGIEPLSGVGFPDAAIFPFHNALYRKLRSAWDEGRFAELSALWEEVGALAEDELAPA